MRCPLPRCGKENLADVTECAGCGVPLDGYARLSAHPDALFTQGLAEARAGRTSTARDLFAAVVHWCPYDVEARNALALAAYELGDLSEARHHWQTVQGQRPSDPIATQGLALID